MQPVLPQKYQHTIENRTKKQISLSKKLTHLLTERNLIRLRENYVPQSNTHSHFCFVCLSGIPPFEGEYTNLDLPGEVVVIDFEGMKDIKTQNQYRQIFQIAGFEFQAKKVRQVILEKSQKYKIIIVYHSFGSFTFMNYLQLFPDHKISGLIDLGGAPLRYYPLLSGLIYNFHAVSHDFLIQNHIQIHEAYSADPTIKQAGFIPFKNSYQTILLLKLATCPSFQSVFTVMRNLPDVLKLFIFGRKDRIFPQSYINQKIVHYSYVHQLPSSIEIKTKQYFENKYGMSGKFKNLQDRFVYSIDNGQHSIHMQKRYSWEVKTAIKEYLEVLAAVLDYK